VISLRLLLLGLAVTPAAIAAGVLFLGSKRPVADDLAFTAPFVLVYALISAAVLVASGASSDPLVDDHDKAVAALVVGLLLLVLAAAGVVRRRRHPDAPAKRGLLDRIDGATPAAAFGIGLVLAVLNPSTARSPCSRPPRPLGASTATADDAAEAWLVRHAPTSTDDPDDGP
jgi:hypothetical protein